MTLGDVLTPVATVLSALIAGAVAYWAASGSNRVQNRSVESNAYEVAQRLWQGTLDTQAERIVTLETQAEAMGKQTAGLIDRADARVRAAESRADAERDLRLAWQNTAELCFSVLRDHGLPVPPPPSREKQ